MKASLYLRRIPLARPFITALRRVESVDDVVLALERDGRVGYGSCSPTKAITGDDLSRILASSRLGRESDCASVRFLFDTAENDLRAQEEGLSLASMLAGGAVERRLESDITISLNDPRVMARDAADANKRGFRYLKLKVGGSFAEDAARLDAVCGAMEEGTMLRLDANQAWSVEEAEKIILWYERQGYPIDLIEQPVARDDLEGMARLCGISSLPIMADESVFNARDAEAVLSRHAASIINIKLAKCGGIAEAERICALSSAHHIPCMMGCMMEGPIAIVAAAHLAAAFPVITRYDLDGPMLYASLPGAYDTTFEGKEITIGTEGGLGVKDAGLSGARLLWTKEL